MQTVLKAACHENDAASAVSEVRKTVSSIIADVRARSDVAVLESVEAALRAVAPGATVRVG